MAPKTKRRITKSTRSEWTTKYFADNLWKDAGSGYFIFHDKQITTSEGHAWPKDRGVRDAGGNFDTLKLEYWNLHGTQRYRSDYLYSIFAAYTEGNSFPYAYRHASFRRLWGPDWVPDNEYFAQVPASSDTLVVPGTKFIADTIPTNPMLDASVSLAELYREGLPAMFGSAFLKDKVGFFRGLAGDYLSLEFGWKPIVSDLKAACKAIMDQESILLQLERDSGRDVHRKRFLPTVVNENVISYGPLHEYPHGIQQTPFSSPGQVRWSYDNHRTQWFSGCYTYHFEPDKMSEVSRIATEARHLYGLELTPEVVWNLAPWSWLVDWITNVGDVFHNVSAFSQDGLVLKYGYVMESNSRTVNLENNCYTYPNGGYQQIFHPKFTHESFSFIRKMRRKATPFGFGLLESSFTVRQWAILAALGITRAPKQIPQ